MAIASDSAEPIERWIAERRVALVVNILKGETSFAEAARLSVAAGVPNALHAGTEWDYQTVLSQYQRRMCLAARVPDV